jgi:predicted phosphoadenosine phosphosulfate sulfurtransferase
MWDYEFQLRFAAWLHEKKKAVRTACLVGIRTQESYNRWRTIYGGLKQQLYHKYQWSSKIANDVYNLYPIYDWKTTDIWTANGKFGWDYNRLYDLYYYAGVSLERQRVASPFISEAIESLRLYKVIEPDMWGKMIGRVNGVNFSALYGGTQAMGHGGIKLPEGHTWKSFMEFLLSTLPEETRRGYLSKLHTSIKFWRTKGGCLSDETIAKLEEMKIPITVRSKSNYKTTKHPVMMEYLDDIDIPEFREIPTYKRMCLCILRNDYACKYMGFAISKEEKKMKDYILQQYKNIWT